MPYSANCIDDWLNFSYLLKYMRNVNYGKILVFLESMKDSKVSIAFTVNEKPLPMTQERWITFLALIRGHSAHAPIAYLRCEMDRIDLLVATEKRDRERILFGQTADEGLQSYE